MIEYPRIFIPDKSIAFLGFVQLCVGDEPFIEFQDCRRYNHGKILESMFRKQNIDYEFISGSKELPKLTGKNYKVEGMGYAGRNNGEILIWIDRESNDYKDYEDRNIRFNLEHFKRIRQDLLIGTKFRFEKSR